MVMVYRMLLGPGVKDVRSVSDPQVTPAAQSLAKVPRLDPNAKQIAPPREASYGLPRNSSIDSAISAISSKSRPSTAQDGQPSSLDVTALIQKAGSPEAVIQYLLKDKQSQSQQNTQLWRLVDKQRAMILGLNKDLERALKDKEKYRKKLKEVMGNPAVSKAVGLEQNTGREAEAAQPAPTRTREQVVIGPDSPALDSDSQKASPVDVAVAPYPITPPADHPASSISAVAEVLNPSRIMPKAQEHAFGHYNYEHDEKEKEKLHQQKEIEQTKELTYNAALPPSRSLPSEPPKMPPPPAPPTVAMGSAAPNVDERLTKLHAPPPRKPPPAPLQLKKDPARISQAIHDEDDSESDYDDILQVETRPLDSRGRRRTREEDDREREVIALREAEARSVSKKSKSSQHRLPEEAVPAIRPVVQVPLQPESQTVSLDAVLQGDAGAIRTTEINHPPPSLLSAGLPASPRPMNVNIPLLSFPSQTTPRVGAVVSPAPLSPRPPRQPIPMPPSSTLTMNTQPLKSPTALTIPARGQESLQPSAATKSPVERTKVFKGLITEEHPDLLLSPNALPSVNIRVASSRMKPSRASLISLTQLEEDPVFTLAVLSRSDNSELWRVEKNSSSLAKLDQRLKQCSAFTARTPDRSLFSGHAPAKLDARRTALDEYLEELLDTPLDLITAIELCRYLSSNVLPPNSDEIGSVGNAPAEGSIHNIGPDGRPLRNGYLTKKGKNFGGWKARFFVLDGPQLKYFETPGGAHLGTIKLQGAQIGKQSHTSENGPAGATTPGDDGLDHQYRHAFLILEPKKKDLNSHVKHVLCAENDKERDLWVDALLQWIDFRDMDDNESQTSKSSVTERQPSSFSESSPQSKAKKGGQMKPQHHAESSETLIGVKYDNTNVGDVPQGAMHSSTPALVLNDGGDATQQPTNELTAAQGGIIISGPKDPQPISDSAAWGNKMTVPSVDEKKQRKRSFFGFGPKARSPFDGQDSGYGADGMTGGTPPHHMYHGPVRQVFGVSLAEAVRYNSPVDVNVPLPSVVYRCIEYLESQNGICEEGIFRLSGSNVVIKQLRERFNTEGDVRLVTDDQYYDIHAVASLLKLYLRELPTTILTRELHMNFVHATEMTDREHKIALMNQLAQRLPQANATLLKYLIAFLIRIINNSDINKMTIRNVGIVFSPTLNIPAPVFALFLQNYEAIFGIEPDEYELPSPISESEDGRNQFDPPVPPGTSSSNASPHRQPRFDGVKDTYGSTSTPPLLMNLNAARGSPTPPAVGRQGYEPSYLAQGPQHANAPYGNRLPNDGSGYERSYHSRPEESAASLTPYDQSLSANSRRRESAVYMSGGTPNLHQQTSRNRLREDPRY